MVCSWLAIISQEYKICAFLYLGEHCGIFIVLLISGPFGYAAWEYSYYVYGK